MRLCAVRVPYHVPNRPALARRNADREAPEGGCAAFSLFRCSLRFLPKIIRVPSRRLQRPLGCPESATEGISWEPYALLPRTS